MGKLFHIQITLILTLYILCPLLSLAQLRISDTNFSKIQIKSIHNLLVNQMKKGVEKYSDFKPSVTQISEYSTFDSNIHTFQTNSDIEDSWNHYIIQEPSKIWNGKIISFAFIYSPSDDKLIYGDDAFRGLEVGQMIVVEMHIMLGLVRIPICFIVTELDNINHEIAFSYIKSGSSTGTQIIKFNNNSTNGTTITHSTFHKTRNFIRDKLFYPAYHKKVISEVHRNFMNSFKSNETTMVNYIQTKGAN